MANKPLILSDNFFDDVVLHPDHVVTQNRTEIEGSEVYQIADNLRDLTQFTIVETNQSLSVTVDCLTPKAASGGVLDRGHNLKGKTVEIRGSTDNFVTSNVLVASCVVPSSEGGLGSDANGSLTSDGVWWKTFASVSYRYWRITVLAMGAGLAPIITGLYLGDTYRFPEYLDSPGAYDYRIRHQVLKNVMSERGVRMKRRIINFSEVSISITDMEEADFLLFHPNVKNLLFKNHPWWFCIDDSVYSNGCDLMRLYQVPQDVVYDPVNDPVHRTVKFPLEEVIPSMTL